MTPEEFRNHLRAHLKELANAYADRWPRFMRAEAIDHFRQGFREGGFINDDLERWDVTRRQMVPFNGVMGDYGPLMSRSGDLQHSIDGRPEPGAVTIFSSSPHAKVHNEGADIPVTTRMRKFFWAMHYQSKEKHGKDDPETEFWRSMALRKKTYIPIPQRKFIGRSKALMRAIEEVIEADIRDILTD